MGPLTEAAVVSVTNNTVFALSHRDAATRQVVARVAGRIFAPAPGATASPTVGDALVVAMNDPNPLVRRWVMDSLGWLRYDRAVQALTDHSSYYGRSEEGTAALHALARIANPASAPVLRALLANTYIPFRVIAIEGLGRIGDKSVLPQIAESQISAREESVTLAEAFARILLDQPDIVAIADSLEKPSTGLQARVYLAEIALTRPAAIHPLLKTPNPSTRMMAVQVLGASRQPAEIAALQPLLQDPVPEVVSVASEAVRRLQAGAAGASK
jgi:HEAT repeat protein